MGGRRLNLSREIAVGCTLTALAGLAANAIGEEQQSPVMTAISSTALSGYIDTSAIVNFGRSQHTVGRAFDGDAKQNGFNLNVVKVQLDNAPDQGVWDAGYRIGLLFGPDANLLAITSTGLTNAVSDFAIKNAYVELCAPLGGGMDVKLGVFDTVVGYEVPEAGSNPNYSRSFGFYLEPAVHTGVLIAYHASSALTLSAGVADPANVLVAPNTINARTDSSGLFSYLGAFALTAPEDSGLLSGATLSGGVIDHGMKDQPDVAQAYIGGTVPTPLAGLSLGLAYDYRGNSAGQGVSSASANTLGGYAIWKAHSKLTLACRVEYASGSNGTWYSAKPGRRNELFGLTTTADYKLWVNTVSRLEFRWDRDLSNAGIFSDTPDSGTDHLSLALNVIYYF